MIASHASTLVARSRLLRASSALSSAASRRSRALAPACAAIALSSLSLAMPQGAAAPSVDDALALVPKDAVACLLVPSPKRASDDLEQCIERMDRPDAAMVGRPIDQAKASLRVSVDFDDNGSVVLAQVPQGETYPWIAVLPVKSAEGFLKGNFVPAPDAGPDAWTSGSGDVLYAKALERHVVLSERAEAVRSYAMAPGAAESIRGRIGPRGQAMLERGDVTLWMSKTALQVIEREGESRREAAGIAPVPEELRPYEARMRALAGGVEDVLASIDLDPLGVGLRTWAKASAGSELATLLAGGTDAASSFDRLPALPFYALGRLDVAGMGGIAALEKLMAAVPGAPSLPAWLTAAKDEVRGFQCAVYPSKLGIATGGLLNDAYLVIETSKPDVVRESIRQAILATAGEAGGVRREPIWTADKELKGGAVADAFEIKETVLPGASVGYERLAAQVIFGSRGFVGFVRPVSGAVLMTFSQRADVLERGIAANAAAAKTYADDGTIRSYRPWLIEGADAEVFIGVGQLGKLMQQVAAMIPGGDQALLPRIAPSTEPVAFALEVDAGTVETATVVPATVLAIFYDQMKASVLGGPPEAPPADAR